MDEQIVRASRQALQKEMRLFLEVTQMPLHLTGKALSAPEELGRLQEIFRLVLEHRTRLGMQARLYTCAGCGHYEGEHHAGDCSMRTSAPIARLAGWTHSDSAPVEVIDMQPTRCPYPDCIYLALPGVGYCAQHRPSES